MAQTARRLGGMWYRAIPCDPPPETLAERLHAAQVAAKAAKRIDTYDRFHQQHVEHHKAQVKVILGAVGLALSVGPSGPAVFQTCHAGPGRECAARVSAIVGALMAMGVTAWSFYDLYRHPSRLAEHVTKLNAEMARSQHAKTGQTAVDNLFDLYRSMSATEKTSFKALLHERARRPRTAEAAARARGQFLVPDERDSEDGWQSAAGDPEGSV